MRDIIHAETKWNIAEKGESIFTPSQAKTERSAVCSARPFPQVWPYSFVVKPLVCRFYVMSLVRKTLSVYPRVIHKKRASSVLVLVRDCSVGHCFVRVLINQDEPNAVNIAIDRGYSSSTHLYVPNTRGGKRGRLHNSPNRANLSSLADCRTRTPVTVVAVFEVFIIRVLSFARVVLPISKTNATQTHID